METMMTESEQMHFAAIAYGGYIDDATTPDEDESHGLRRGRDGEFYLLSDDGCPDWTPRTDNGQAFELAMRTGIAVFRSANVANAQIFNPSHHVYVAADGDIMAAARKAVFLAAVEIGKAKK
jgi:hypothetical protein